MGSRLYNGDIYTHYELAHETMLTLFYVYRPLIIVALFGA